MRRLENLIKYIVLTIGTLIFLIIADILILAYISVDEQKESVSARYVANRLEANTEANGNIMYALTQEGADYVDAHNGFVFLMDNDGAVLWEYHMPKELPRQYTIEDALKFSRYYLYDYPVYTHITDNGIVVVGTEKGKTWKYTLTYHTTTLNAYIYAFPTMITVNLLVFLFVAFVTVKHDHRRREKERTTWIAGVSHDIRTPLSLVLGYADEILHLVPDSTDANFANGAADAPFPANGILRRAEAIEEQAVRIKNLVTNLNTENKLTYGMGSWKKEKILLPAVIRDTICEMLNRNMDEKYDICVRISEELEQLYIKGDKELVKRLLENLINNAVIHNPQGCEISVSLTANRSPLFRKYMLEV
ncbi:MAG: hypothetical protein K2N90_00720, partial [Lachnospiraceae bacterium]|nr:hypothetical protein [Lachnospiraceae bacterium]